MQSKEIENFRYLNFIFGAKLEYIITLTFYKNYQ